ncbi:MAG: phosphate ABC transporter permease PstA [Opitutales bacterium]|jgi:phosphate transport system permease protein|nr:phosphate ABC transporter permease PstA [Opitutales bacterium]
MKDLAQQKQVRVKGEIAVWFSSLGLALGLVMIVALLGIIAYNGISVFWPKRVVQLELDTSKVEGLGNRSAIAGVITSQQNKSGNKSLTNPTEPVEEWQLFVGNKDQFGFSYKYFDQSAIQEVSQPEGLLILERAEYGNAIAYPVSITYANGDTVLADDPHFKSSLKALIQECHDRREKIRDLEYNEIGAINKELESLRLEQLKIERKSELTDSDRESLSRIENDRTRFESSFETLAAQARGLREHQESSKLLYRLASGEEVTLSIGNIYSFYYPNQLGFFGRVSIFVKHIVGFLIDEPREANTEGGVFPAIFGTFVMTLLMSIAVTPFGVLAAIYLREYANDGFFVRSVRIAINNLAGVPSIVFGVFGLGFFVYFVGGTIDQLFFSLKLPTPTFGTGGIIWASLTLALMTVPVVIVAAEEALASVSRGIRESSLACGASKWQTIQRVVLPASAPGILTGMILAMARGAGEVAPLMLVGVVKIAPSLPIDDQFPFIHFERKFMHLGFHIYDLGFQSPDSEASMPMVFATTLLLIVLIVMLNLVAIMIRNRLRRKYKTATF